MCRGKILKLTSYMELGLGKRWPRDSPIALGEGLHSLGRLMGMYLDHSERSRWPFAALDAFLRLVPNRKDWD